MSMSYPSMSQLAGHPRPTPNSHADDIIIVYLFDTHAHKQWTPEILPED